MLCLVQKGLQTPIMTVLSKITKSGYDESLSLVAHSQIYLFFGRYLGFQKW
jgi:hypothetical protein